MKTHRNYIFIQILIYFLFTTLFKLVASSFWKKKVADLYEQRRPSVLIETPAYV